MQGKVDAGDSYSEVIKVFPTHVYLFELPSQMYG